MPPRRAIPRRLGAPLLAFAALVGSTFAVAPARPAAAVPTYGVDERAQAIASPALIFLESTYTGVVRDAKTGKPLQVQPMVVYRRCSGFLVNPEGYALTTSLCVRPSHDIVRQAAFYKLGRQRNIPANRLDGYVKNLMETADFTGAQPGTKPGLTMFAQLNVANAGLTSEPAIPVTVVGGQDPAEGNVAVVKLDQKGLPTVELDAEARVSHGSAVIILGFDTKDPDANVGTYTLQAKTVDVTSSGQPERLRVTEDVGPYSHGGMVLDTSGRVVAMIDVDIAAPDRPNRALIGMTALTAAMSDHDVRNELSDVDRAYRRGLDAYFGGRYSTAVREFDAVLAQAPSHLLANIYRKNAADRYAVEGDAIENAADWPRYLLSAAAGALLVLLLNLGWRLITWRRRAAHAGLAPVSTSPYAPTSGAGAYPVSGEGAYSTAEAGEYSFTATPVSAESSWDAPASPPGPLPPMPAAPSDPAGTPPSTPPAPTDPASSTDPPPSPPR